ncbi:MAG: glycosyltransferase family 39 protein [Longimicrobiales bacterium]|nr:glycosyltransferase family 39 protein [Longimicrobiales bacterium]
MTRRSWLLLAILLLLEGVLVAGVFLPSPHSGGDNAGYVALAQALAGGEGYTEVWDPARPPHTKYPPVFPLLLAFALAAGAAGWASLKAVPVVAALAAVAGVFLWARRRLGEGAGFAVALLTGLSPSLLYHAHWLLSDVPFLAFTALALWQLEAFTREADERDAPGGRPGRAALALSVVLVALAAFTRTAGLPLAVAAVGACAWRRRRWREAAALGVGVGVPALLWALRGRVAGPGEGRYGSEFFLRDPYQPDLGAAGVADFAVRVGENLTGYGLRFLPETLLGSASPALVGLLLAVLALALAGWVRALRRSPGAAELFVPLYAGLIVLWPAVWSGDRFALPLVPLLLVYGAEAAHALLERRRVGAGPRRALLAGAALLVALPALGDWVRARDGAARCRGALAVAGPWACGGLALVDFAAAARWAGEHLPPGSAALVRKPRIWYAESGVPARTYPFSEASGALVAEARRAGAEYVVLDYLGGQGARFVGAALAEAPEAFCEVARFGGAGDVPATRILRLLPPGETSASRRTAEGIVLAECAGGPSVRIRDTTATGPDGWRIPILGH